MQKRETKQIYIFSLLLLLENVQYENLTPSPALKVEEEGHEPMNQGCLSRLGKARSFPQSLPKGMQALPTPWM